MLGYCVERWSSFPKYELLFHGTVIVTIVATAAGTVNKHSRQGSLVFFEFNRLEINRLPRPKIKTRLCATARRTGSLPGMCWVGVTICVARYRCWFGYSCLLGNSVARLAALHYASRWLVFKVICLFELTSVWTRCFSSILHVGIAFERWSSSPK